MHVPYACRHSGACCSSGWSIPVERDKVVRIATLRSTRSWLQEADDAPPDVAGVLAFGGNGHCVFHQLRKPVAPEAPEAPTFGSCEIHAALGPRALPVACQHFPRECLIDSRGVFVTLSHYCPTAATLLWEHSGPVEIVEGPASNPHGEPEGLDARKVLPPLLTPGVLMDPEAYSEWEAHVVRRLAGPESLAVGARPDQILETLESDARKLAKWRPGGVSLRDAIRALNQAPYSHDTGSLPDWDAEMRLVEILRESIAAQHRWEMLPRDVGARCFPALAGEWTAHAVVINRFLAAHAFATWMAYQGSGVESQIRELRLVLAVLRHEAIRVCRNETGRLSGAALKTAIRRADLMLVHLADRERLNAALR